MNENKKIIIISVITVVLIGLLVCMIFVDIPLLGSSSIESIIAMHDNLISKEAELVTEQNGYQQTLSRLETVKQNYQTEKSKYDAISDETINIIKESNTEENYSLEYMWIKLGNYAKKNNLTLVMVEPGNSSNTGTADQSVVSNSTQTSSSDVLKIQVTGNYIDLSDFIFEVENDEELKFKLDNISMEYVSGTTIKTTFDVKNIIITK